MKTNSLKWSRGRYSKQNNKCNHSTFLSSISKKGIPVQTLGLFFKVSDLVKTILSLMSYTNYLRGKANPPISSISYPRKGIKSQKI